MTSKDFSAQTSLALDWQATWLHATAFRTSKTFIYHHLAS